MDALQAGLALASGSLVGFTLGLVGGGGSVLAVPLLVYLVGITNPHVAIGTSAVAVAANAFLNLLNHGRKGNVKWRCATVFTLAGVLGAVGGAWFGRQVDGDQLLAMFAVLMMVVGGLMLRNRNSEGLPHVTLGRDNFPKLVGFGLATGLLSGFFGIGGGFLIVPGLIAATGMPITNAMASSLLAVTGFGLTTSASYSSAELVNWAVAGVFIAGGFAGGLVGTRVAQRVGQRRGALNILFAGLIFTVAAYMLARTVLSF